MRIEIDLPDWVDERHIYVMAGIELAAVKLAHEKEFHIKTGRCSYCGQCCTGWRDTEDFPAKRNGSCVYLKNDGEKRVCSLGVIRPLTCSMDWTPKPNCTQAFS